MRVAKVMLQANGLRLDMSLHELIEDIAPQIERGELDADALAQLFDDMSCLLP